MDKASNPRDQKGKSNTTTPFNEYDDLATDELPPVYAETAGPSSFVPASSRPPTSSQNQSQSQSQNWPQQQFQQHQYPNQYTGQYPNHAGPSAPFNYPPGFICHKCRNTGMKLHNGQPCGTCERAFGRQTGQVYMAPYGMTPANGVTYMAGDPRIGGRLCGNCKGGGIRSSLFGMVEEQCYVCRGVGRIL